MQSLMKKTSRAASGTLLLAAALSNIAATVANLLGLHKHDKWDDSLLELK